MLYIERIKTTYFYNTDLEVYYEKTKAWAVANRALAELAASFAFNVALITFTTTPLYVPALYLAATHLAIGGLMHVALKIYKYFFEYKRDTEPAQEVARASAAFMLGRSGPQIAIHESGHALMAKCCFKNAQPLISIFPFRGGMTSYVISKGLTDFGKLLGKQNALLLIASAGPIATTLVAMAAFALAHNIEGDHPLISQWLTYQGAAHILSEVMYGLSAFIASPYDYSHDFVYLWKVGNIHPLIPVAIMITVLAVKALISQKGKDTLSRLPLLLQ